MTFSVTDTTTKMNVSRMPTLWRTFAGRFGIGQWSFIGPGSEKKWYPSENSPQGAWGPYCGRNVAGNSQKADILSSVQRLHCPGGQLKSKGRGKLSIHFTADQDTVDTIYRIIHSVNQLSIYGAVQLYARNLKTIKIERGNLWYWWDSQLFLVKSKQKFLSTMKIPGMTKLFGSNTFNKLNRFHQKKDLANFVRK